jgi:drug/metabolite transporter (DMT)-like permease
MFVDGKRRSLYTTGILAALFATAVWSLNFVIPFVIGDYSIFDFALFRFVFSGMVGIIILVLQRDKICRISLKDVVVIAWLSFTGYVGFFLFVASSALYAGPVIAPAILSLVPIVLSICGNRVYGSVPWRALFIPLAFIVIGLVLVNGDYYMTHQEEILSLPYKGIGCAISAVILWTWFGLLNASALKARPSMDSSVWSAMLLIGGGVEMLLFFPIGVSIDVFKIIELGLSWSTASSLWMWGVSLAIISSVGGAWAWTIASRNLPIALLAQLVVFETIFGVLFGLITYQRRPSIIDISSLVLLIGGVVVAIRVFYKPHNTRC